MEEREMDLRNMIDTALARIPVPQALQGSDLGRLVEVRMLMRPVTSRAHPETQLAMMHEDQLLAFITAKLELHYEPGKNPYTGLKTHPIWEIRLAKLGAPCSTWHTTPGLHVGRAKAAHVLDWNETHIVPVWSHPDHDRYLAGKWVNDDRVECELNELPRCGTCFGLKAGDDQQHLTKEASCICPATSEVATDQPS